jgi:hypothetical protein
MSFLLVELRPAISFASGHEAEADEAVEVSQATEADQKAAERFDLRIQVLRPETIFRIKDNFWNLLKD